MEPREPPTDASPLKPAAADRLKRDEWSEGAVSCLLEAYEGKWVMRNRAKLKGHDWEDVARHVSARAGPGKSPKTQTQCKNKIESMKKRYRSESAADASTWPLYSRLDQLLRGNGPSPPSPVPVPVSQATVGNNTINNSNNLSSGLLLLAEPVSVVAAVQAPLPVLNCGPSIVGAAAQNSLGSNGVDRGPKAREEGAGMKTAQSEDASEKHTNSTEATSGSSTPALYSKGKKARHAKKAVRGRRRSKETEIAESIRWLADAVVKAEQARMEAAREIERMRAEAEAKRAETDLKRTEIIANTQLEIARLFAAKTLDSSLRIGRS